MLFILKLLIANASLVFADTTHLILKEGHLAIFAPPVINKDYFLFEFGFVTEKRIKPLDYHYNAFVTAAFFEDWLNQKSKQRAGALGFKGGVILPTQPWKPLFLTLTGGFAKTVLHRNPFFGKDEQKISKKDMVLVEVGLLYSYEKYHIRFSYQKNNVKYFNRQLFISMGINY